MLTAECARISSRVRVSRPTTAATRRSSSRSRRSGIARARCARIFAVTGCPLYRSASPAAVNAASHPPNRRNIVCVDTADNGSTAILVTTPGGSNAHTRRSSSKSCSSVYTGCFGKLTSTFYALALLTETG